MYKKSVLQSILLGLIALLFVSCDKDFNELGTDIVGDDHFGFERYTDASIKAYNQQTGPIASNNLAINPLGYYYNPAFGRTQANFVTQIEMATVNPTFNNTDPEDYDVEPTKIDSVIVEVPYFCHIPKGATIVDNVKPFVLDSIYGDVTSKFKLEIFQSNYYLRDLDPGQSLSEQQSFYTDENNTIDNSKIPVLLNDAPRTNASDDGIDNLDGHENDEFYFDKREHETSVTKDGATTYTRSLPSMRLHLNKAVFTNLILNAPEGKLADNATFKNYFRGLYFKTSGGAPGHMAMLNFKAGKITIYYNEDKKKTTTPVSFERVNKTYVLNMTGNCVSLLNNDAENTAYLNAITNNATEASKLYLKGGEGSVAMIDLFGDPASSNYDTYRYSIYKQTVNGNLVAVDQNGAPIPTDGNGKPKSGYFFLYKKEMIPNGISDELDELRYPLHFSAAEDPGQVYRSVKNRWMINEANLVFNIATTDMSSFASFEPNRILVYDLNNRKAIVDYSYDLTSNALYPKFNKAIFGGLLVDANGKLVRQKDDNNNYVKKGAKYKVRLTNHIRNLIKNDSTNVRLGVSVTENIANIAFAKLKTPNSNFKSAPSMSVMSPLGTILYGTDASVSPAQRLKLEIYYTKPD
ncbi:DUF4270 domain-containing protein [Flavobacterium sp.]